MLGTEKVFFSRSRRQQLLAEVRRMLEKLQVSLEGDNGDMLIQMAQLRYCLSEVVSIPNQLTGDDKKEREAEILEEAGSSLRDLTRFYREERLRYAKHCLKELRQGTAAPRLNVMRVRFAVEAAGTHLYAADTSEEELAGFLLGLEADSASNVVELKVHQSDKEQAKITNVPDTFSDFEPEISEKEPHDTLPEVTDFDQRDTMILPR